jgi:hypothetical protein
MLGGELSMRKVSAILFSVFFVFFLTACATTSTQQQAQSYRYLTSGYNLLTTINTVTYQLLANSKITKTDATEVLNLTRAMRIQLDTASNDLKAGNVTAANVIISQISTLATNVLSMLNPTTGKIDLSKLATLQGMVPTTLPNVTNSTQGGK